MRRLLPILVLGLALGGAGGCSPNPATGGQSFTAFMSAADEIETGKREHPKLVKEFGGEYRDREVAAYVRNLGLALARTSELPGLSYSFTVLNDETVNAMALPGGYVHVSRGLLALVDNEAELAGVLAHEIGHVTARHAAQRYSQALAANIGLTVLGAIGSYYGVPAGIGDVASVGTQIYLQSYSREQELEADLLAVRYMTRAGYDPTAMISVFRKLDSHQRLEAALRGKPQDGEAFHIMASHPRTAERIAQAIGLAGTVPTAGGRLDRDAYLDRIDGLLFGDDPREGVRKGRVFSHPELRIEFTVPAGFTMFNAPDKLVARGPQGAAIVFDMEAAKRAKRVDNLVAYLTRDWGARLSLNEVERIEINGMEAATGRARSETRAGSRDLRLIAIRERADRIFQFIFLTPPALTPRLAADLQRTTYSFRRLSAEEAAAVKPLRIRVVTVGPGDSAESLARRMPLDRFALEWLETLNGLERGQPLTPGNRVKIVAD